MPTLDSKGSGEMKRENIRSKGLIAIGVIEGLVVIGAEPETAICPQPATLVYNANGVLGRAICEAGSPPRRTCDRTTVGDFPPTLKQTTVVDSPF